MLIAATEDNVVQAIDAGPAAKVWRQELGRVVPARVCRAGTSAPLGVTGTPVIDVGSAAIYLDAFVTRHRTAQHLVFGLSLADGSVLPGWPVDIAAGCATTA